MTEAKPDIPRCKRCDAEMEIINLTPRTSQPSPVYATYSCPRCHTEITKLLFNRRE